MNIKDIFLENLEQNNKNIKVAPSTITESLLSPSEDKVKDAVEEISGLMTTLVSKYKNEIFPIVTDTIENIDKSTKSKMEDLLKLKINIYTVDVNPDVIVFLDNKIENIQPKFVKYPVTLPQYFDVKRDLMLDTLNEITRDDVLQISSIINGLLDSTIPLIDLLSGKYGNCMLSKVVAYVYNMDPNSAPEGTLGKIDDYREAILDLRNYLGYHTVRIIQIINESVKHGRVINSVYEDGISIFKPILDIYYNKGGTIEGIYGLQISGNKTMKLDVLLTNHDKFVSKYKVKFRTHQTKRKALIPNIYMDAYKYEFSRVLREQELPGIKLNDILDRLKSMSELELTNIKAVVSIVIGEYIFPETGVKRFITNMEYYLEDENQTEAVGLAALDMVTDYMASQITIV